MSRGTPIKLTDAEREQLEKWVSAATSHYRVVERARIILAMHEGETNRTIAAAIGIRSGTVSKWRTRFARNRLAGLNDLPRSGVPLKYDKTTVMNVNYYDRLTTITLAGSSPVDDDLCLRLAVVAVPPRSGSLGCRTPR